ncbi:MAG: DNA double-strand break repair nuclease NurA [Euryarchaeota archaeon]|nr:DNA double-strand break repair nuclease NurA [Euryarchaeota archaeon]
MPSEDVLELIAKNILEFEWSLREIGDAVRALKQEINPPKFGLEFETSEDKFVYSIHPHNLDQLTAIGVDGGVVNRPYHSLDLILVRAVAAIFNYREGVLRKVQYYPEAMPEPSTILLLDSLSYLDFGLSTSLERQKAELKTANDVLKKYTADVIFLDGSIAPQHSDKPSKNSKIQSRYAEVIKLLEELYEQCEKNKILLVGVVEDSRGTRFIDIFRRKILESLLKNHIDEGIRVTFNKSIKIFDKIRDTHFLHYILDVGERSYAFRYSDAPAKHPTLQDIHIDWASKIFTLYLKPAMFDRPLRIEFLCTDKLTKTANIVSSIVFALSKHHDAYAFPTVLTEADVRAKLSEDNLEFVHGQIMDRVGRAISLFELRRNLRPFR